MFQKGLKTFDVDGSHRPQGESHTFEPTEFQKDRKSYGRGHEH